MTPERFLQIEQLFHAVREGSAEERSALLAHADPELRREVESLLAGKSADLLLDRPAVEAGTALPTGPDAAMPSVGTFLGPYRVEAKLGEGGMGEVFRAIDTRLGRAVAVKITREQFGARFEREARAISALNHPNICTLYDVGPNYLVMELLEGETIAARLRDGPLPLKLSLHYALQIASALVEAHDKGVVHRDLKPANIMIARSRIKVLDFGLAKAGGDQTVTASRTVMGTPAYMAPEQWDGKPADVRSDIYSFGCVLYEMLTGARVAGQRKRISSRRLESIVTRCLHDDPARRWQSVAELERELTGVSAAASREKRSAAVAVSRPEKKVTIVLAEFENATGDPVFDGGLGQILAMQLENSPQLSLLPDARVSRTLGLMDRPAHTALKPDVAAEVCERTASAGVVEGTITSIGSQYVVTLRARNCQTGDILHKEQAPAARKEDVFKALAQLAQRFGTRVAASLPPVEIWPGLKVEATTPSLEAWRSYNAAMKAVQRRAQSAEATSLLKRAIEIDPSFAVAHAYLGRNQSDLGETETGAQNLARAYELRGRVSDREDYFITFGYHRQVTRNLELARQTLESWAGKYPDDFLPHGFLSGFTSPGSGHYDKALAEGLRAIELDPAFAIGYENVAWVYVYLNRPGEAEALLRRASERNIEVVQFSLVRYAIAFLRGDNAAMETEAAQRRAQLHGQGSFEQQEASTLAHQGRLRDANRLSERAVALARQGRLPERAALFQGARAVWNVLFGRDEDGQRSAAAALSLSRSRDAAYGPAFALALLQESTQAGEVERDLAERYPEDTSVQFSYLPALRALAALAAGDPVKALEMTEVAAPYDLAVPGTAYFTAAFFGALYPVYVRGLAYRRCERLTEAAGEFQKIVDHAGLTLNDPIGPMARLQLARAFSDLGEGAKSAAVYQDLLALWKDADADIPILQQARAEYGRLQ